MRVLLVLKQVQDPEISLSISLAISAKRYLHYLHPCSLCPMEMILS